jgi:hypothetical protein
LLLEALSLEIRDLSAVKMQRVFDETSAAGHDAQDMALIAPTGMIFVPSANRLG